MPNIFDSVAVNKIKKSLFNMSHVKKLSCNLGYLIPIQCMEVIPNDTFHFKHEVIVKFSPLIAPMMQECDMYIEDFYVPNRIVWNHWEDFIKPSDNGSFPSIPQVAIPNATNPNAQYKPGSLMDYLGYNVAPDLNNIPINTLALRAYQLIWNEYYRDQNLQAEVDIRKDQDGNEWLSTTDTPLLRGLYDLRKRCWPKDYFTSALPTTQRGGDVHLPLSGNAPVVVHNNSTNTETALSASVLAGNTQVNLSTTAPASGIPNGRLWADLSSGVSAATINELRRATALQEYLELNMRVGGRYTEYIYGNFGVRVPDYRLDRPYFLGGSRKPIVVDEVVQQSETNTTPLGELGGRAFVHSNSKGIKFHSMEHGFIISLLSVLPKASYQQGVPRKFTRRDPLDFANPKFANLGEQAILNKEIYASSANPNNVFGYTPRYSEYKYEPSTNHGEFKTTLNYWHMGRIFASEPALNASFVAADPATRPFAVTTGNDKLRVEVYNQVKALRPLPYYGTPKLI